MINEKFQPEYQPESPKPSLEEKRFEDYRSNLTNNQHELADVIFADLGTDFQNIFEEFLNNRLDSERARSLLSERESRNESEKLIKGHIIGALFNAECGKK